MTEVTLSISALFEIIAREENMQFRNEVEYFQNMQIEIPDEFGSYKKVRGLIKKRAEGFRLELDADKFLECADSHLLLDSEKNLKTPRDLKNGDRLITVDGLTKIITNIERTSEHLIDVFDLEIDNDTHLYSTPDGLIHHNTLLTSALVKYANDLNMRSIVIVPSSSLLKQTYDYIKQFDIPVGMYGNGKKEDEPNIVATWQTLQNSKKFIRDFQCIIWDECHNAKAFVAQQIMQEAVDSYMRLGLTGTVPKDPLDKANLTAAFGGVIYDVKAHELQKRNILSSIDIHILALKYPKDIQYSFIDWAEETTYLQSNEYFAQILAGLVESLPGNTLILLKNIDPAEEIAETLGCTYISSKLKVEQRQEKFNEFIYGGEHTAVGTYSLLSTGIDIVHINNLILAPTPGKSFSKVIQSIGRGLRRKEGQKEHVTVIDFTSNLKFDKRHIKNRKEFYEEAKYPFQEDSIDIEKEFNLPTSKKSKQK